MGTREKLLERIFYKMVMIGDEDEYLYRPLEKQDVYDILSAETKEQQKCEYCHKGKHIELCNDSYLEMVPDETRICKKRDFDYEEWRLGTVKFSFCPMCGRKLS